MSQGSVFVNNRTQAVRLPADMRFPDGVKKVTVRSVGKDSFFLSEQSVTDDFMNERAEQVQPERANALS